MEDRHARHRRPDADRRRRPVEGFRASSPARFDRLVDDAIATLPRGLLVYLDGVLIAIEDLPPADPLGTGEELVLGLFQDGPRRSAEAATRGARITLYRRPIEARARNRYELADIVQETVVHEIAHRFDIDDDRLDELGWR